MKIKTLICIVIPLCVFGCRKNSSEQHGESQTDKIEAHVSKGVSHRERIQFSQSPSFEPLGCELNEILKSPQQERIRFIADVSKIYKMTSPPRGTGLAHLEEEQFVEVVLGLIKMRKESLAQNSYEGWETVSLIDQVVSRNIGQKIVADEITIDEALSLLDKMPVEYPSMNELGGLVGLPVTVNEVTYEKILLHASERIGDPSGSVIHDLPNLSKLKHDGSYFTKSQNPVWLILALGQAQTARAGIEYLIRFKIGGGKIEELEGIRLADYDKVIGEFRIDDANFEIARALGSGRVGTGLSLCLEVLH